MKKVLSPSQMRLTEKALFDTGVPSADLMEKAARVFADEILKTLGDPEGKTAVFACGSGGNGGDGFAAARMLRAEGVRVVIVLTGPADRMTEDARRNFERVKPLAFGVIGAEEALTLPRPSLWADAMSGIGFHGTMEERLVPLIRRIEEDRLAGVPVVSCDIASGLDADTGIASGACVRADKTVTFHHMKYGHALADGPVFSGGIVEGDIGLNDIFEPARLFEASDLKGILPERRRHSHKNEYGHVLLVAGSRGMAGAAAVCASAAMRSGAGLVTVACPESIVPILQTLAPCAMCAPLPETDGAADERAAGVLEGLIAGKTVIAAGPGLSVRTHPAVIETVLRAPLPKVLDADALNLIAENRSLLKLIGENDILTPHPGEAARLLGRAVTVPSEDASALPGTALLKGATSVIHSKRGILLSASGTPGMAKGGSGDALTGIIAALAAQGVSPHLAAAAGSEIHGLAGEAAAEKFGVRSMLPTDLIACLGDVFTRYV